MSKFYSRTYFNTALMGDILSSEIFKVWYKKKYLATLLLLSSKTVTGYAIVTSNNNTLPVTKTSLPFLYKTDAAIQIHVSALVIDTGISDPS